MKSNTSMPYEDQYEADDLWQAFLEAASAKVAELRHRDPRPPEQRQADVDAITVQDRKDHAAMWRAARRGEAWALEELAYSTADTTWSEPWKLPLPLDTPPRSRAEVRAVWRADRMPLDERREQRAAVARHRARVEARSAATDALIRQCGGLPPAA